MFLNSNPQTATPQVDELDNLPPVPGTPTRDDIQALRDSIFDVSPEEEFALDRATLIDITKRVYAVKKLEKQIEGIEAMQREMEEFYEKRKQNLEFQIETLKGQMKAYMDYHGYGNVATQNGTVYVRKSTSVVLDAEMSTLVAAARQLGVPVVTEVSEKVNISQLKKALKEVPEKPEWYKESSNVSVSIR